MSLTKSQIADLTERFRERSAFIARATVESIVKETDDQKEKRIAALLKPESYSQMFGYYFGKDTPIPMADCDCAWYHSAIYNDLYNNNFITLFNLIFRGGAKSTHANLGYVFGLKQTGKAKFFLVIGANELRATMLLQDLQLQLEHNARITDDFGSQRAYGSWADGMFETTDRCTFMALGIEQPVRGLRANGYRLEYVSIDDVEDKKRALNQRLTREIIDKITADVQGAFSARSERTIISNNYFVRNGIVEGLLTQKGFDMQSIDTRQNTVLERKYAKLYLINLTDKYYQDITANPKLKWKPSWPERFDKQYCLRKIEQYAHNKEVLSGEFYNTPINAGKKIKNEMIRMVEPPPLRDYTVILENWDLAYSDAACYKAKATLGIKDGQITVIDVFCRQTDIGTAMEYHYSYAKRVLLQNPSYITYYDASVAQETIYENQWLQAAKQYGVYHIPLPQKSHVDKYIKIDTTLIGAMHSGVLAFASSLEHNPDWHEAKAQLLNFEKGGKYPVDFPDALSDAIIKAHEYTIIGNTSQPFAPIIGKRKRGIY